MARRQIARNKLSWVTGIMCIWIYYIIGTYIDVKSVKRERLGRGDHPGGVPIELVTSPVPFD